MELIEALHARRTTRAFTNTPVTKETLLEIVDAARYSPSGSNKNNFRFVVTTKRETMDKLATVHQFCKWMGTAQAAIALVGDPALSRFWVEDCSLAAYSIYLGALAKGVGCAWSATYISDDPVEDGRRQGLVRDAFSIPANMKVAVVLGLGYAAGAPNPRKMCTLDEVVSWEKYGQK